MGKGANLFLLILFSLNCIAQTPVATIKLLDGRFIHYAPSGRDWSNYDVAGFTLSFDTRQILIDENNPITVNGITVSASGYQNQPPDKVYPPSNIFDNDLNTKWAAKGFSHWLQFTFPEVRTIQSIDVAFTVGSRNDVFDLLISTDSITWTTVLDKQVGNLGTGFSTYNFTDVEAKYIKYVAQGNTQSNSDWNSISEIRFNYIQEELPCDCPETEHDTIYIDRIDTVYLQPKIFIKADSLIFQLK